MNYTQLLLIIFCVLLQIFFPNNTSNVQRYKQEKYKWHAIVSTMQKSPWGGHSWRAESDFYMLIQLYAICIFLACIFKHYLCCRKIKCVHVQNTQGTSFGEQMAIYTLPMGS